MVAALERKEPNILPPFGFNRILSPKNYESRLVDLMNVKYILSMNALNSPKLSLAFEEGNTKVYYNKNYFPRAFLVNDFIIASDKQQAINLLYDEKIDLHKSVVLEDFSGAKNIKVDKFTGEAKITSYEDNQVKIQTNSNADCFLVLTDSFYPGWQVFIDGKKGEIYRAYYNFRAVSISKGVYQVIYKYGN